jgi:hypothetical protein
MVRDFGREEHTIPRNCRDWKFNELTKVWDAQNGMGIPGPA